VAHLIPEKELDCMLDFSQIDLSDAGKVRGVVVSFLGNYRGVLFHPLNDIDEFLINSMKYVDNSDLLSVMGDIGNIHRITRKAHREMRINGDDWKWVEKFCRKAFYGKSISIDVYKQEDVTKAMKLVASFEDSDDVYTDADRQSSLKDLMDFNARTNPYFESPSPDGEIDLREFRLFWTSERNKWDKGLPQPILQSISNGLIGFINNDFPVGVCEFEDCDNFMRLLKIGGRKRRFCSDACRNKGFRSSKGETE